MQSRGCGADSGKQLEVGDVLKADDAEVASIQRADVGYAKSLGKGDQAAVDATEVLIAVLDGERGDSSPVGRRERLDADLAGSHGLVERGLGRGPELPVDQPSGLGDHEFGRDEWPGMCLNAPIRASLATRPCVRAGTDGVL